jgi:hypothetical protein
VYALSDRTDGVIAYAGDAHEAIEWAKITPGTWTQSVVAQNGADALLVHSDGAGTNAGMWVVRYSESNGGFGTSDEIRIDPSSLLADWTLEVRKRLHMRFRLIDANRDLSFFWLPSGNCSVLRRSDQPSVDVLTWSVGVPVGFANLFDASGSRIGDDMEGNLQREIPITIQRPPMTLPNEATIPSGSPYTEHWRTLNDGAGCAWPRHSDVTSELLEQEIEGTIETVRTAFGDIEQRVKDAIEEAKGHIEELSGKVREDVERALGDLKDAVERTRRDVNELMSTLERTRQTVPSICRTAGIGASSAQPIVEGQGGQLIALTW